MVLIMDPNNNYWKVKYKQQKALYKKLCQIENRSPPQHHGGSWFSSSHSFYYGDYVTNGGHTPDNIYKVLETKNNMVEVYKVCNPNKSKLKRFSKDYLTKISKSRVQKIIDDHQLSLLDCDP